MTRGILARIPWPRTGRLFLCLIAKHPYGEHDCGLAHGMNSLSDWGGLLPLRSRLSVSICYVDLSLDALVVANEFNKIAFGITEEETPPVYPGMLSRIHAQAERF